jgi:hypothetical protein
MEKKFRSWFTVSQPDHRRICSIKETKLFLREVKSKEQSTAQHSTVEDRKLKEGKMISIIVSLIMSFQE